MAYREYRCETCGAIAYAFENEVHKLRNINKHILCKWKKMPPSPVVIHTTECFMSEPVLDSMDTAMELDRILTREKSQERELKQVLEARKHL
jgi:hypothetical protein